VDLTVLSDRYRELQQIVHPDRFANSSEQEKRLSMQSSVLINEAYNTLKSPLSRIRYLLSLKGVDASSGGSQDTTFLMEQIELREKLESVSSSTDPFAAIGSLMDDIDQRIQGQVEQITPLLEGSSDEQLMHAQGIYQKMQFLNKLQHDAESIEEELDDSL